MEPPPPPPTPLKATGGADLLKGALGEGSASREGGPKRTKTAGPPRLHPPPPRAAGYEC